MCVKSKRLAKFPKLTSFATIRRMRGSRRWAFVPTQQAVEQATPNAQDDTCDIRDPVVYIGATVEIGLDELNHPAEGRGADEDGQQAETFSAR